MHRFLIIGHRGAAGLAPENTLASIRRALEIGVDRVEIDIRQTRDNVIVVIHDKTMDRTTDGKGRIKELTYAEILRYSAGIKAGPAYVGEKIPTLEEALKLIGLTPGPSPAGIGVKGGRIRLLIEIKEGNSYYPGIIENTLEIIRRHNAMDWCMIHSFSDEVLYAIHRTDPDIILHKLIVWKIPFLPLYFDTRLRLGSLRKYSFAAEISVHAFFLFPSLIREIHSLGKKVNAWTVNDTRTMKKLIRLKTDGIITDYPDRLKRLHDHLHKQPPE